MRRWTLPRLALFNSFWFTREFIHILNKMRSHTLLLSILTLHLWLTWILFHLRVSSHRINVFVLFWVLVHIGQKFRLLWNFNFLYNLPTKQLNSLNMWECQIVMLVVYLLHTVMSEFLLDFSHCLFTFSVVGIESTDFFDNVSIFEQIDDITVPEFDGADSLHVWNMNTLCILSLFWGFWLKGFFGGECS